MQQRCRPLYREHSDNTLLSGNNVSLAATSAWVSYFLFRVSQAEELNVGTNLRVWLPPHSTFKPTGRWASHLCQILPV
jgi:hypothetical protein